MSSIFCPVCGEEPSPSSNTSFKKLSSGGGSIFQCFLKLFSAQWKEKVFSFCEQCTTHIVLISELQTELQKLEMSLNLQVNNFKDKLISSERKFESSGLYQRDNRYLRFRRKILGGKLPQTETGAPCNSNDDDEALLEESLPGPAAPVKVEYIMVAKEEIDNDEEDDFNPIININSINVNDNAHNFEAEDEHLKEEEDQSIPLEEEEEEMKVEIESDFELSSADEAEEEEDVEEEDDNARDDDDDEDYVKSSSSSEDSEDDDEIEEEEEEDLEKIASENKGKSPPKTGESKPPTESTKTDEDTDYPFITYRGFRLYRVSDTHYKCSECSLLLPNRKRQIRSLRTHIVREHTTLYTCPHCPKRFGWHYNLNRHIDASHKKISVDECPICGRPFTWKGPRDSHIWTHYSDQDKAEALAKGERLPSAFRIKYKCSKCPQRFIRKSHLDKHFKANHVPKELRIKEKSLCGICGAWVIDLYQHKTFKHASPEELKFGCNLCHKKFSRGSILRTHKRTSHAPGRPWKCEECGRNFRFQAQMKEHQKGHESVKPFQCQVCGKQFTRKDVIKRHMKEVHKLEDSSEVEVEVLRKDPENGGEIQEEGEETGEKLTYIRIQEDSNSNKDDSSPPEKKVKFDPSSSSSRTKRGGFQRTREIGPNFIAYHDVRLYHVSKNDYKCSQCEVILDNSVNQGNLLRSHVIKEHTNLNVCPHCPSRFDRASRLKTHVENVHKNVLIAEETGETEAQAQERKVRPNLKKFRCEVENCGGSFTGRLALAKHFKSMHTNEKEEKEKHLCGICGKTVIDLKLHMTVKHTPEEEKNFECDLCPKKFSMEKLLKDHKKKAHAPGKPWKCKVCGKDFKFEKYLKEHEIGHEEVKPFECHLCGMGFTRRHVLNRHLGNVHEGKNREDKIKKWENGG
ncbi:unnamed protein product [Orchesella dallaii]|uniref:C2H2-type domain-containing protein n=1 Tax=Orchesella dallaii TaxID=48710 RepID=A0ABP1RVM4_9HEXA